MAMLQRQFLSNPFLNAFWVVLCLVSTSFATEPQKKLKYGPEATPLSVSHEYFVGRDVPGFWAMMPYYRAQEGKASCSVAAGAMAMNAILSGKLETADDALVTEDGLLKTVNSASWKMKIGPLGRGVTLDEMGRFFEETLKAYKIKYSGYYVVHAGEISGPKAAVSDKGLGQVRIKLHEALLGINSRKSVLIVNFLQGVLTGDASVGHFAPIGAYDPIKGRVLVMDPDREYYEPYWVSEEVLLKSMATVDQGSEKTRGFISVFF